MGKVQAWINKQLNVSLSPETISTYIRNIKSFCTWMCKCGRAVKSPVKYLKTLNPAVGKKRPRGGMCCCPAHNDRKPSLSVREEKPGGRIFVKCFAGCPDTDILKCLGLDLKDLFPEQEKVASLNVRSGLKVAQLAEAKKLPVKFLQSLGVDTTWMRKVRDGSKRTAIESLTKKKDWDSLEFKSQWREVIIPYYYADGTQARRRRIRITGTPKHCWAGTKSDGEIIPYGLNRLQIAKDRKFIFLVEGETDC
jgi:hypothetical protein